MSFLKQNLVHGVLFVFMYSVNTQMWLTLSGVEQQQQQQFNSLFLHSRRGLHLMNLKVALRKHFRQCGYKFRLLYLVLTL